jgi:nucleoside 2-deoxyribosyltransferase
VDGRQEGGKEAMRVYVAGKTGDFERVRLVQGACVDNGHTITYDWTSAVPDGVWVSESEEAVVAPAQKAIFGENDMRGVRTADLLIALPHDRLVGTYIEIGMALAWNLDVWLLGDWPRDSVFFYLDNVSRMELNMDVLRRHLARLK